MSTPFKIYKSVERVAVHDLCAGDHLFSSRSSGLYSHHGIFIGGCTAIHYAGWNNPGVDGKVEEVDLDVFFQEGHLCRVSYQVPCLKDNEVVHRARGRLGENEYSLLFNNCEHFAAWCKTGVKYSQQVLNALDLATHCLDNKSLGTAGNLGSWPMSLPSAGQVICDKGGWGGQTGGQQKQKNTPLSLPSFPSVPSATKPGDIFGMIQDLFGMFKK